MSDSSCSLSSRHQKSRWWQCASSPAPPSCPNMVAFGSKKRKMTCDNTTVAQLNNEQLNTKQGEFNESFAIQQSLTGQGQKNINLFVKLELISSELRD